MSEPVELIRAADLAASDPTPGMARSLAFETAALWAGQVETAPGAVSGWHHHDRNETSLYVVSGHLPPGHPDSLVEWDAVARLRGTVVLLMAVQNLPQIAERLVAGGRDEKTPVAVVSEGTMPGERTVLSTLGAVADDVAREEVRPPAIVVIGDVVAVARPDRYDAAQ